MDTSKLADEIQGLVTGIGRSFLFAHYLPALLFVALHHYALLPAMGLSVALLPTVPSVPLLSGELLTALLLALFLAMLSVSLNSAVLRFFEGLYPWQRSLLLRPWQRANQRKNKQLYGELQTLKAEYRDLLYALTEVEAASTRISPAAEQRPGFLELLRRLWRWLASVLTTPRAASDLPNEYKAAGSRQSSTEGFEELHQIALRIQKVHEQIEDTHPVQTLPLRSRSVRPTTLGNTLAISEEYPLDRYGMDAVLFWPRLRQVADAQLLRALDNSKMLLDFQLNLSMLALVFAVEAAVFAIVHRTIAWGLVAGSALLVARLAYSGGVRVAWTMGTLMNTCFDLYRGKMLEQFGLAGSDSFFEDYKTWLRLSAFLRRGELFYWPDDL